jgi:hypothetical protein
MRLLQWVYVYYISKYFEDLFALQWSNGFVARAVRSRPEPSHGNTRLTGIFWGGFIRACHGVF